MNLKPNRSGPKPFPAAWVLGLGISLFFGVMFAAQGGEGYSSAPLLSSKSPLGGVLESIADWAASDVFVDLMRQARGYNNNGTVPVDENGWPLEDCEIIFLAGRLNSASIYNGTYRLSYSGHAQVQLSAVRGSITGLRYDPAADRTTAEVNIQALPSDGGWYLILRFSQTAGRLKNIRLIRPGYDADYPPVFTREFLQHLSRFPVLRFMEWSQTNRNPPGNWDRRSKPDDARQTEKGVAWEYMIQLANELKKDIWINIPHTADDNYVTRLARLLRTTLLPGLKVYVEFSNEVWNGIFSQNEWNRQRAAEDAASGNRQLDFDGTDNIYYLGWRRTADLTRQVSELFRREWGEERWKILGRPVLAGQIANPEVLRQGLLYLQSVHGPPARYLSALAGAPYFHLGDADLREDLSPEEVLDVLEDSAREMPVWARLEENAALARWYGLDWVAYEGGPDTMGPHNVAAKKSASLHPRMQTICEDFLRLWEGFGGGLFVWYLAGATSYDTAYGTWGLTNDMTVQDTPKIRALDSYAATDPGPLKAGFPVPGRLDARRFVGHPADWAVRDPYLRYQGNGSWQDYLLQCPKSAFYRISLDASSRQEAAVVRLMANSEELTNVTVPASDPNEFRRESPSSAFFLPRGLNVLRLFFVDAASLCIREIVVEIASK